MLNDSRSNSNSSSTHTTAVPCHDKKSSRHPIAQLRIRIGIVVSVAGLVVVATVIAMIIVTFVILLLLN